jgi:hypothetical protein
MVLRGIFRPKKDVGTGDWRKLHDEGLHNFFFPLNTIQVASSRRMNCAGHVAPIGNMRNHAQI